MLNRGKFEKDEKKRLRARKRLQDVEYEAIKIPYILYYNPDLIIPTTKRIVELKGWNPRLSADLSKMKKVKESLPTTKYADWTFCIVWQKLDMKVTKTLTAKEWSIKNGIEYAEGTIPESWFI